MGLPDWFRTKKPSHLPPVTPLPLLQDRIATAPVDTECKPKPGEWISLAMFNESLIDKEWKLAGDRASLMVSTQTFLFAAYILVLMSANASRESVAKELLRSIPIIGIIIIAASSCGIFTAVAVARYLEKERSYYQGVLERVFKIRIPDLGSRRGRHGERLYIRCSRVFGTAPFVCVTILLLILWGLALSLAQTAVFPPPGGGEHAPLAALIPAPADTRHHNPTSAGGAVAGAWILARDAVLGR